MLLSQGESRFDLRRWSSHYAKGFKVKKILLHVSCLSIYFVVRMNSFTNQQFEGTFFLISANLRSWSEELGKALLLKHKSASAAHTAAYSSDTACKSRGGDSAAIKRTEYQMQTGMQQPMLRKQYSRYSYAS